VLWSSDLRGFTTRSDRLPGQQMVAILNALFDAQANAIHAHGGEILKFIGDGLLAIFLSTARRWSAMQRITLWRPRCKGSKQYIVLSMTRRCWASPCYGLSWHCTVGT